MARMYPMPIQEDTNSQAERDLYQELHQQLDETYTIIHSATWQYLEAQRRVPRNGEADFVILHPTRGILVIEVKGGIITRDAQTGTWTSTSRTGQVFVIKNPFEQAKNSMYTILKDSKKAAKIPSFYTIGHIVCFPDCTVPGSLGIDMPRQIIIDQMDMLHLGEWVEAAFTYYRGNLVGWEKAGYTQRNQAQSETTLGREGVAVIRSRLMSDVEIRPLLWGDIQREHTEIIRLTKEQFHLLGFLNNHHRVLISGPGGSGKTMLALEKARRLASQKFQVLYTCFNTTLAEDLRTKMGVNAGFDIISFHQLCARFANRGGLKMPAKRGDDFYQIDLPNLLLTALDHVEKRYDAIIVDEGQDFYDAWWLPLQMLLANEKEGVLYIFYDDNQRIYSQEHNWPIDPSRPYQLTVNCRNTKAIHRIVEKYYQGIPIQVQGPEGRKVSVLQYDALSEQGAVVCKLLDRLVVQEGVPTKEIVVLSPFGTQKSPLWRTLPIGQIRLSEDWPPPPNHVFYSTIHSFKGLERSIVILTDVNEWPRRDELIALLYVACSRACHQLYVILPKKVSADRRDLLDFTKIATIVS